MALDVQKSGEPDEAALNNDINVTPLVDVMLVMLIIFLITIPVIVKVTPVALPNYRNVVTITKPENIVIAVTSNEQIYYNNEPISISELKPRLVAALQRAQAAGAQDFPEVHIRGDKRVRFEAVGRVILACQEAGILKVGFLTEPHSNAPG
jgi:biopolymer transport protein ExbD